MAKGYLVGDLEQGASPAIPLPGNELNTPTLSTKRIFIPLMTTQPTQGNSPMNRDDELRNSDEPLPLVPESYIPTWSVETRAYPDSVGFLLANMLGRGAGYSVTLGDGVITDQQATVIPTGAFRHRWTAPFGPAGLTPQTAQYRWAYTDEGTFIVSKGSSVDAFSIDSPAKGGVKIKASGPSLYLNTISDPGLTPGYESFSLRPFERSGLTLPTWLAGSAVHEDFNLAAAAPTVATPSLGIQSKFPDLMEKGDGLIVFTGSVPQRQLNQIDWNAMRDNIGFPALAKWQSDSLIGATAFPYKLFVAMSNCQYEGGEANALTNARRIGSNFTFRATTAGAASVIVELISATASYS